MKTYVLSVEVPEGRDEFWEQVEAMKARPARKYVRDEIKRILEHHGFDCKVHDLLVRRR